MTIYLDFVSLIIGGVIGIIVGGFVLAFILSGERY